MFFTKKTATADDDIVIERWDCLSDCLLRCRMI